MAKVACRKKCTKSMAFGGKKEDVEEEEEGKKSEQKERLFRVLCGKAKNLNKKKGFSATMRKSQ